MLLRRLTLALLLLGTAFGVSAQDIHYTLHNYSPMWLNPATTGAFYGSIRVSGHYRGQYLGAGITNSPNIALDAPIMKGLRKQDWIGVGANLIYDQANGGGIPIFRQSFGFSAAYHLALDKKQRSILTLGASYGSVSIGVRPEDCISQNNSPTEVGGFGRGMCDMFTGGGVGSGGGNNQNQDPSQSYNDINAGLTYRTVLDVKKDNRLELGFAMLHINNGDYRSLVDQQTPPPGVSTDSLGSRNQDSRRPGRTLHTHANLDIEMTDNIRFMPTVFWQANGAFSTVSLQAWAGLELKNEMMFKFGLGYRTADAGKILLGFTKDRLNIAASYDVVLSQAVPTDLGSLNSVEIAANYIFNIYKKPEIRPSILCPRI